MATPEKTPLRVRIIADTATVDMLQPYWEDIQETCADAASYMDVATFMNDCLWFGMIVAKHADVNLSSNEPLSDGTENVTPADDNEHYDRVCAAFDNGRDPGADLDKLRQMLSKQFENGTTVRPYGTFTYTDLRTQASWPANRQAEFAHVVYDRTHFGRGDILVGFTYLFSSPESLTASASSIGVYVFERYRSRTFAKQAIEHAVNMGINELGLHRIQAKIRGNPQRNMAVSLYMQLGFEHEGIHRLCSQVQGKGEWRDVTYLGMLDTQWMMRTYYQPAPRNVWEEMFKRHAREREELLMWDHPKTESADLSSLHITSSSSVSALSSESEWETI